jgi:hypothetical protein
MSCSSLLPATQQHLVATSTTLVYVAMTDWIPVAGLGRLKGVLKLRNADSTFRAYFAGQTASVRTDKPDAWATFGSSQTDDGEICVGDNAVDMSDKAFVRFGIGFQLTEAGFGQADATFQMSYDACGRVVGTQQLSLRTATTTDAYEPITG